MVVLASGVRLILVGDWWWWVLISLLFHFFFDLVVVGSGFGLSHAWWVVVVLVFRSSGLYFAAYCWVDFGSVLHLGCFKYFCIMVANGYGWLS